MSTLSGTKLPEPTDWQDFERKTRVLFRYVLDDPNTQQNGRQGQPQHGVDVWGYRDGDAAKLVGVQCKQKYDEEVTNDELEKEVTKALKFNPPIAEFILVTTARRDQKIQTVARQITARLAKNERPVKVAVWGWDDISEHAAEHDKAWLAFDPSFDPFSKRGFDDLSAQLSDTKHGLSQKLDQVLDRLPSPGALVEVEKSSCDDTEIFGQIKAFDAIASSGAATIALQQLTKLKEDKWKEASEAERYRIHVSLAATHHQLGDESKAAEHLLLAVDAYPHHEKAALSQAKAKFLQGDFAKTNSLAEPLLQDQKLAEEAAGIIIQSRYFSGNPDTAMDGISDELVDTPTVQMALIVGKRSVDDPTWREIASKAYERFPKNDFITWFAADALLDSVLKSHPDLHSAEELNNDDLSKLRRADEIYSSLIEKPERQEHLSVSLANNATLVSRLLGDEASSLQLLERGLQGTPEDQHLLLQKASICRDKGDYESALDLVRENIDSGEGRILRAECLAAIGKSDHALLVLDTIELDSLSAWLRLAALAAKARCLCDIGDGEAAKQLVDKLLKAHPTEAIYLALKLKVYGTLESENVAEGILAAEIRNIDKAGPFGGLLELSYEARRFGRHDIVVDLLQGRVNLATYNEGLKLLLRACIDGNSTKSAQDIFDKVPDEVSSRTEIKRARAVFALRVGDPDTEQHVDAALESDPKDLELLLAKFDLLLRQGREADARRLIKDVEASEFDDRPENVMFLANVLARYGRPADGLELAYRTLMDNWDNATVHLRYHSVVLVNSEINDVLPFLSKVTESCVVALVNEKGDQRYFRIEASAPKAFGAEYIGPTSDLAKVLDQKEVGDVIKLPHGLDEEDWKIVSVKHPALDALHRSMNDFNRRFPRSKGLMQFEADVSSDEPFADMKAVMKASAERDESVLDEYRDSIVPFLFVSSLIGRDPIEAWMGLIELGREFRVCLGTADERSHAHKTVAERERRGCILDPITLSLIHRLKLKDAVENICGPLHTTQSVIDVFVERDAVFAGDLSGERGSVAYRDGELVATKYSEEVLREAARVRREELEWVRTNVKTVAAIPAADLSVEQRSLIERIDNFAWEPVVAAQGNGLLLLTDDMGMRAWASGSLQVQVSWLQPVLSMAADAGKIDASEYHKAITSMALAGHSYISLSPEDLFYQFEYDSFEVSDNLIKLVNTTTGANADLKSNMPVLAKMIGKALSEKRDQNSICRLANACFTSLARGRTEHQRELLDFVIRSIPKCPDWLKESAISWLVGHSIGAPYFEDLVKIQKQILPSLLR